MAILFPTNLLVLEFCVSRERQGKGIGNWIKVGGVGESGTRITNLGKKIQEKGKPFYPRLPTLIPIYHVHPWIQLTHIQTRFRVTETRLKNRSITHRMDSARFMID